MPSIAAAQSPVLIYVSSRVGRSFGAVGPTPSDVRNHCVDHAADMLSLYPAAACVMVVDPLGDGNNAMIGVAIRGVGTRANLLPKQTDDAEALIRALFERDASQNAIYTYSARVH